MDETGSRLLIIGLIIAGFMLFNHFARQAAMRLREQQETAEREAATQEEAETEDIWGRPAPPPPPAPNEAAPASRLVPAGPPRARAAHPLFRTRQDLRRAVIAMTVLGPCRAQEPPEQR